MLSKLYLVGLVLSYNVAAVKTADGKNSTQMALSIISRAQGLMTGTGGASELLQAGVTQKAFTAFLSLYHDSNVATEISQYVQQSAKFVVPFLSNSTYDALSYPMDRLSNGNALLQLALSPDVNSTEQLGAATAASALRQSIDLNRRNVEGGLWYYVYPEWSYLDGMYSLAPFYAMESIASRTDKGPSTTDLDDMMLQLDLLWQHNRNASSGLLVHGYDDSRTAVWADPITGASPHVWGRSLGWFAMALVDTLEILGCRSKYHQHLLSMLQELAVALAQAVDPTSGAWWQILDEPGATGNYIESSGSSMLAYTLLKGARLGYLTNAAALAGRRAHGYLTETFVVRNGNGTVGWNGTVAVCSLNSTASYAYYVGQPLNYNSVLGSAAYIMASVEVERFGN